LLWEREYALIWAGLFSDYGRPGAAGQLPFLLNPKRWVLKELLNNFFLAELTMLLGKNSLKSTWLSYYFSILTISSLVYLGKPFIR